jgi:two-component system NarL family sensor kinase
MTAVPALRAAAPGPLGATSAAAPGLVPPEGGGRPRAVVLPAVLVLLLFGVVVACLVLDAMATDAQRAAYVDERGVVSGLIGSLVGLCGAVILAYRPVHVVGLLLAGTGLFWAVDGLCESYAVVGLPAQPVLPLGGLAYWFFAEVGSFLLVALPLLVLYPTGRLPAGRWRFAAMLAMPLAAAVVFARHARAEGTQRTQLRWLLWLLWAALVCLLAGGVMLLDLNGPVGLFALVTGLVVTSVSLVIGVVRPQTGDIDALVGGTLVYGGIAAVVVALDLVVLATASRLLGDRFEERQVTLVVLVLAVAAYGPLRGWLTTLVRRRLMGRRGERYEVVSALAERLEESGGVDQQLPALASTVAEAFRVGYVRVEVLGTGGEALSATHGTAPGATQSFPIGYRGQRIGSIELPEGGIRAILSRRDQALLIDVVRQAAIAVRSGLLARELQESREQLVLAREEDRRRIRRDLHDGLGPVLGGVAMRLDAARNAVATDPETAHRLVVQSRAEITEALADVRRLVHGFDPRRSTTSGCSPRSSSRPTGPVRPGSRSPSRRTPLRGCPRHTGSSRRHWQTWRAMRTPAHARSRWWPGRWTSRWRCATTAAGLPRMSWPGWGCGRCVSGWRSWGGRYEVLCPPEGGTTVRAWLPMGGEA